MHSRTAPLLLLLLAPGCRRGPLYSLGPAERAAFWATATAALIGDFGPATDLHCVEVHDPDSGRAPTPQLLEALEARGIAAVSWDMCVRMRSSSDTSKSTTGRDLRYIRLGLSISSVREGIAVAADYSPVRVQGPPESCTGVGRYVLAGRGDAWRVVRREHFIPCF